MAEKLERRPDMGYTEWATFADGQWWKLTQGHDFPQNPERAIKAARRWGVYHRYSVSAQSHGDHSILVRFDPISEEHEVPARKAARRGK